MIIPDSGAIRNNVDGDYVMKKLFSMLSIAVAVMMALSCSKETPVDKLSKGTPIEIVVPNIEIDSEAAGTDSKVTWKDESARSPKWESSDAFQMIAYSVANQVYTNWGDFTVSGEPSQYNTKFTGYKPDGFSTETGGNYFVGLVKNPFNRLQMFYEFA